MILRKIIEFSLVNLIHEINKIRKKYNGSQKPIYSSASCSTQRSVQVR